jgi:hypothetical protein
VDDKTPGSWAAGRRRNGAKETTDELVDQAIDDRARDDKEHKTSTDSSREFGERPGIFI